MSPRRLEADQTRRLSSALLATDEGQRDAMSRPPNFEEQTQTALTHANRVAAIGQLSVSIMHEVSQPISATLYNAQTALEVLSGPSPDIEGVRQAVNRILRDCNRATSVLSRIRAMVRKTAPRTDDCRLNEAVAEVVELTYGEAIDNLVSVTTDLADPLPLVRGDRVQLQQVVLNLVINAIEAMSAIEGPSLHFGVCLRLSLLSGKGCRQRKT